MQLRNATDHIIVHCSATYPGKDIGATEIRELHAGPKDQIVMWNDVPLYCKGWDDIGYHYVIRRSGALEKGRPLDTMGAHVRGWNAKSIGICLIGGGNGGFDYTRHQMDTLQMLIHRLLNKYPGASVRGHNSYDAHKTCPNFEVEIWWDAAKRSGKWT